MARFFVCVMAALVRFVEIPYFIHLVREDGVGIHFLRSPATVVASGRRRCACGRAHTLDDGAWYLGNAICRGLVVAALRNLVRAAVVSGGRGRRRCGWRGWTPRFDGSAGIFAHLSDLHVGRLPGPVVGSLRGSRAANEGHRTLAVSHPGGHGHEWRQTRSTQTHVRRTWSARIRAKKQGRLVSHGAIPDYFGEGEGRSCTRSLYIGHLWFANRGGRATCVFVRLLQNRGGPGVCCSSNA